MIHDGAHSRTPGFEQLCQEFIFTQLLKICSFFFSLSCLIFFIRLCTWRVQICTMTPVMWWRHVTTLLRLRTRRLNRSLKETSSNILHLQPPLPHLLLLQWPFIFHLVHHRRQWLTNVVMWQEHPHEFWSVTTREVWSEITSWNDQILLLTLSWACHPEQKSNKIKMILIRA